jgi:UDP-3-O-[3-hydroxymyristoyl] glucosamine N-acyltransferase
MIVPAQQAKPLECRSTAMLRASQLAVFLGVTLHGPDLEIEKPYPISESAAHGLYFVKRFRRRWVDALNSIPESLVLAGEEYAGLLCGSHLLVQNPRLAMARVLRQFFAPEISPQIASTASVHRNARLGQRVFIGEYSVIGDGAVIGDETVIGHHVVIAPGTRIGCGCVIKSHSVIGEEGFAFEFDEQKRPVRIPHLGRVILGDEVEIGALCTVARGTLGDTILEDEVKLDDHVHIAHNVRIGSRTLLTACAEVSGSVEIGRDVWVGPNATVNNGVKIADENLIGIGSVVLLSTQPGERLSGNPARPVLIDEGDE